MSDRIGQKLESVMAQGLTLEDRFLRTVGSVRAGFPGRYPESRRAAVESHVCAYIDAIVNSGCIERANADHFDQVTNQFVRDLRAMEQPAKAVGQRDLWAERIARVWKGPEIDELFAILRQDDQILDFNWKEAVIEAGDGQKRTVSREWLRLRSRPSYSHKSESDWIAQWPAIVEPEAA